MGCNARCGVMHNVADISGAILNMVLQSGIVCCERCWCDMKWAIRWGMMVWRGMWPCYVEMVRWCKMWWDDVTRCEMPQWQCVTLTFNISPPQLNIFHIKPHFRHSTSFHITPHLVWHWCATFCNARCGMLYLIHPVAVMWTGKVQCRICATSVVWCCDVVQRQVWNVVMRWGMWRCADARCEMWLWK